MRYTYVCDVCKSELVMSHPASELGQVVVQCPACDREMRIKITPPAQIIVSTVGNRGILGRDRPSNREYQAYKAWEDAGGQPGTTEHKKYLEEKGYE